MTVVPFRPRERQPLPAEHFTELSAVPLAATFTVEEWGQIKAALELSPYDNHRALAPEVNRRVFTPAAPA